MRNILMTVMMLVVVIVMFNAIVTQDTTGTRSQIESQGTTTNTKIGELSP